MKKFETPSLEIEELEVMDVISASTCEPDSPNCGDDGGIFSLR